MLLNLVANELNNEILFDSILRKINYIDDDIIKLDISKADGISDLQLTTLPFIISYIKHKLNKTVNIHYYIDSLLDEDSFYDYLTSSGFFDLIEKDSQLILSRPRYPKTNVDDPLIQYQAFKNIVSVDSGNDISQKLLYEMTSCMDIVADILKEEVFGKTDVAVKMSRIITKELIENINQHSNANMGVMRLKYEKNPNIIISQFENVGEVGAYFKEQKGYGFFVLTVSDDGEGMVSTLKNKYQNKEFIPYDDENLDDMMAELPGWWIERAFKIHNVKESKRRSRLGLRAILDTVCDYDGLMFVRTEDASLTCWKSASGKIEKFSTYGNPFFSGTHYAVFLPAKEKRRVEIPTIKIYSIATVKEIKDLEEISITSCDMAEHYKLFPLITNIKAGQQYVDKTVEILNTIISNHDDKNNIIQIDFSNAVNARAQDYVHIIQRLYKKHGRKLTSNCILRNLSQHVLIALNESKLAVKLWEKKTILFAFDCMDAVALIGSKSKVCAKEIKSLLSGRLLKMSELSTDTRDIILTNGLILSHGQIEGDDKAYALPFKTLFANNNKQNIKAELEKSKALATGHFAINDMLHVDGYLIPHLMFQNPIICRMYAKEIAKTLGDKIPDRIVTYATTGVILYFYLKEYYYKELQFTVYKGPSDVTKVYGSDINSKDIVIIVTDVSATGSFITRLRDAVIEIIQDEDHIILEYSIYNTMPELCETIPEYDYLMNVPNISIKSKSECLCNDKNSLVTIVSAPETSSELPSVYQRYQVNVSNLNLKRELASKYTSNVTGAFTQVASKIDDENLSEFELFAYWRGIRNAFQGGHVEREHIHFDVYDIPERLLFKKLSGVFLESYIKQFVWSFKEYIDYVIYPRHYTAAYLAHLVASKFVKKPIVIEARFFSGGYLALPDSATTKMEGKNILIVDDACNTGMTLKQLIGLVSLYGGNVAGLFTISNRNSPENEVLLRKLIPKVATAYRLNLNVYSKGKCYLCNKFDKLDLLSKRVASKRMISYLAERQRKYTVKEYERQ